MTEISATVAPQAAAALGQNGPGINGGAAPFGALGFLNLILSNIGQGNGQGIGQGGIGLVPGQAPTGDQTAQGLLQNIPGLQQALQGNGADAAAVLQALQNNSQIDLSPGGLAGGVVAQLIANIPDGQIPGLGATVPGNLSHQLTGEEILQFDPTQLTIEQLISGELESVTLPNGKEITQEQALLALLLKGRISAPPPEGAVTPGDGDGDGFNAVAAPVPEGAEISIPALAKQIGVNVQTGEGQETVAPKPTRPDETLAALLAATGQPVQPPPETPPTTPGLPQQALAGQSNAPGTPTPPTAPQSGQPQNAGQQNQAPQNIPAPQAAGDEAARPDYEWRASQANSDGRPATPGANGRDTAIQSLLSAINRAQPTRMEGALGPQHALSVLQNAQSGIAATGEAAGNGGEFDLGNGGRGPFANADGLIEEMLTQHNNSAGRGGEARPSQSFTSLLTTARSATTGHPATQTVAFQMSRMSAAGMDRITLRLDPPELGRVEVRMEFGDDGKVRAHLIADRPDTLDTLQRDARALERALQDAGLDTDEGSLTFDLRQGDDNNGHDPQDGRSRNAYSHFGADGADEGAETVTHVNAMPGGMAGHMRLDLLV